MPRRKMTYLSAEDIKRLAQIVEAVELVTADGGDETYGSWTFEGMSVSNEGASLEFSTYCPFAGTTAVSVPLDRAYLNFNDPDEIDTSGIIANIVRQAEEAEPDGAGELVTDDDGRVHFRRHLED